MDNKQARYLHRMLDRLAEGKNLSPEEIALLRKNLPELPKQKTLEEIAWDMHFAWSETFGNDWKEELFGDLESWLSEQHSQLRAHLEGVKSQAHPALPAGMRIAEHENFGRVVVSPGVGIDRCHEIFYLDPGMTTGTDISEVEPDSLTFIDSEPAKSALPTLPEGMRLARHERYGYCVVSPNVDSDGYWTIFVRDGDSDSGVGTRWVPFNEFRFVDNEPTAFSHPEFLETEGDYARAPEGTIVARSGQIPWVKESDKQWSCISGAVVNYSMAQNKPRRILRWGWGE